MMQHAFDSADDQALHSAYMKTAIEIAKKSTANGGGPFGAVIVRGRSIVGKGNNRVTLDNDPTAHAEMVAIRMACKEIGTYRLEDCTLYTTCEPCPMCFGAIYWSHIPTVYFACTRSDAGEVGFDDAMIYEEFARRMEDRRVVFREILRDNALAIFALWTRKENKTTY